MLEVRNIAASYPGRKVLRDVSFVVSSGEIVSVVGANGAGKTTLMRILATLNIPDDGQVLLDGKNAFEQPMKYRHQIGYMPESVALYPEMRVKDYLSYRAALKGEGHRRVRRRVGEALELTRLESEARSRIGTLSVGQRKRVALADAILLRPRVLILDDFLSGLDGEMRAAVGTALADAAAFSSVIVTGHELEDLAKWTTRFLVLREGVISSSLTTSGVESVELRRRLDLALNGGLK